MPPAGDSSRSVSRASPAWIWLLLPLAIGASLRLLAAACSDPTPGDDVGRLVAACAWARDPRWEGLSGVWAPLHTYVLGALIHAFGQPLLWTRVVGWLSTTASIPLLFGAVREGWRDVRVAGWSALLLAVYYVHIGMAASAYVEGPYVAFLLAAVWLCLRAARDGVRHPDRDALAAGAAMTVAVLLRHEAKLVWVVMTAWMMLHAGRRATLRFALPSGIAIAWQLLEPSWRGGSFAHDVQAVAASKLTEVALHGSRLEAIRRWIVMPAGSPSALVVVLGAVGLWRGRRALGRDLFAWLFFAQVLVYFALTVYPGWQPYLRYMMLYFLCLLPHAGASLAALGRRGNWIPATLVMLVVVSQGAAWWVGRNERRPLGWLPIYRAAADQRALDAHAGSILAARRVLSVEGYPQTWDVFVTLVREDRCDAIPRVVTASYADRARLADGGRIDATGVDLALLDPTSRDFDASWASLPAPREITFRTARLCIVRTGPH